MTKTARTLLGTILALFCLPAIYGQGAVPVGEFQINSFTPSSQSQPSMAELADGGIVVVWASSISNGSDTDRGSIQGQRYAIDGTALGEQFQVNSYTSNHQSLPSVAAMADGGFAVSWRSDGSSGSDSSGNSIQGQRFAADGTALGVQFQVNSHTTGSQSHSSVAALSSGGFVTVWFSSAGPTSPDPSLSSIQGQRFTADGAPLGGEFLVNTYTLSWQFAPSVAALPDGGFVAVWNSYAPSGSDFSGDSIQGQRYAADGTALGGEFQINSYTTSYQSHASVAALADGSFIVVWHSDGSNGSDSSGYSIQGQRYAADGTFLGGNFQVNSHTATDQRSPSVATLADNGFVAVWQSYGSSGSDSSGPSIQGQRFAADGMALGGEFQVNSYTTDWQFEPTVAALADGDFVAAWGSVGSSGSDSSGSSIQGQRYAPPRFALVGLAGKCLDIQGEDTTDGTPVSIYRCHGGENQTWRLDLTSVPQRVVGIGGKCLIPDFDHPSGVVRTVIGACGSPDDLWQLVTTGHARPSALIHAETGLCLDVEAAVPDDGTPTRLFECHGGANQVWRPAAEVCTRDSLGLCLNQERFRIDLAWRSFDDTTGSGKAVSVGSDDSGLLWFFEADNWEMLIKVLDACAFNDRLWVFAAATTTVEYTLTVTDTQTGAIAEYFNPLGNAAAAITDTEAFDTCPAGFATAQSSDDPSFAEETAGEGTAAESTSFAGDLGVPLKGSCVPSLTRMCLSDGRVSIAVTWRDYTGNTGNARVVGAGSPSTGTGAGDTSGMFWFFDSSNWEMLVKVLDACDINGKLLFLGAATTDVEYTLTVTETQTGVFWQHTNSLGNPSEALVHWFETCS